MAKEAEAHSSEDKEKREEIDARNSLDGLVYNIEKMLKDSGEKVQAADKTEVEAALAESKKAARRHTHFDPAQGLAREAHPRQPQAGRGALQGHCRSRPGAPGATGEPTPNPTPSRRKTRRHRRRVRRRGRKEVGTCGAADPPFRRKNIGVGDANRPPRFLNANDAVILSGAESKDHAVHVLTGP